MRKDWELLKKTGLHRVVLDVYTKEDIGYVSLEFGRADVDLCVTQHIIKALKN